MHISMVRFVPMREGKFSIQTSCSRIAILLRGFTYLEERLPSIRGVCFLPMLEKCTNEDILEELRSCNQTADIIKVERLSNGKFILTFSNSLTSVFLVSGANVLLNNTILPPFAAGNVKHLDIALTGAHNKPGAVSVVNLDI